MSREITSRQFRDHLADELDKVQFENETLIVTRRKPSAAVVPLHFLTLKTADEGNSAFRFTLFGRQEPRTEVAQQYRELAADPGGESVDLPAGESAAIEFLLLELAALYGSGDPLGQLAAELAEQIKQRKYGQVAPPPIKSVADKF